MAIREELLRLLRGISGINFVARGVQINTGLYQQVATAVEGRMTPNGRLFDIQVIVNPGVRTNSAQRDREGHIIAGGIDAEYHSNPNFFAFPETSIGSNIHLRALAIHEATHAAFDLNRIRVWSMTDEAISYIAQCVYLRNNSFSGNGSTPIFNAAFAAADSIRGDSTTVPLDLMSRLERAIATTPSYRAVSAPDYRYIRNG